MDRARHQLLAGPTLTVNEHGGGAIGHLVHQGHHGPERRAHPDEVALGEEIVQAPLQRQVLGDQLPPLQRLADDTDELGALEGLGEEVHRPVLHRRHRLLHGAEGGEQDHVDVGHRRLDLAQQLEPGEARHAQVGEEQVHPALAQALERRLTVGREHHGVPLAGEGALQALPHRGVIVGDEKGGGLSHARSS